MTVGEQRVVRDGPHPVVYRTLEVLRSRWITPRMVRVTLGGTELAGFASPAPDDHVKLFFPKPGQSEPAMPAGSGGQRTTNRDYTPRRHDAEAGELDIDFVIHGDGPASTWAAGAEPGDRIGLGGPRGSLLVADDFDWYLLAGDETALPAIGRRIEELPARARALVFVEVADASEEQSFDTRAELAVTWLHRGDRSPGNTGLLERALREAELPDGDGFAFVAGEAGTVRPLRQLLPERGLRKEWTRFSGYWKSGKADYEHD